MADERSEVGRQDVIRWAVVLGAIVLGVVLYFVLVPRTPVVLDVTTSVGAP